MPWPDFPPTQLVVELALWMGIAMAFASVPSVLKSRRGSPLAALSWLFTLMLFPGAGALLWWFFGRNALRRRRRKRAALREEFRKRRENNMPDASVETVELTGSQFAEYNSEIQDCADQSVRVLCEGPAAFARIDESLAQAKVQISVLYYLWANDETGIALRDRLCERAKAGVAVRVLVDAIGSLDLPSDFWKPLTQAGASVAEFMPPRIWTKRRPSWNFRNHRKILVVDHEVGFSGGMNVSDQYADAWKDVHLQTFGAAARALEQIFCDDWFYTTGEFVQVGQPPIAQEMPVPEESTLAQLRVLSSGPDSPQPWIHDHYFRAMAAAKERIWIATPYFVPTESICTALRTAATRGVEVRVLVPGKSDRRLVQWATRAYYPNLIAAGVEIYEYQTEMMHAKVWVIDEQYSAIGSANLDPRSFRLNFEVTHLLESQRVVQTLEAWFGPMFKQSLRISEAELGKIPPWQVLRDAAAHLWSPLL